MNKFPNVCCVPFKDIKNAYVIISACKSDRNGNGIEKRMSFFFDNGEVGAEWEPDHGPITVLYKCDKDHEAATPHWFYEFTTGQGHWSQLAVDEESLSQHFLEGNYDRIFQVLNDWANR